MENYDFMVKGKIQAETRDEAIIRLTNIFVKGAQATSEYQNDYSLCPECMKVEYLRKINPQ